MVVVFFFLQNNCTGFTEGAPYSKGESGTPGGPEAAVWEETKSNKGKVNFWFSRSLDVDWNTPQLPKFH